MLVVGDANPDLILSGDVAPRFGQAEQLLTGATVTIGGSGAITAHGLARLARPVGLVAAVGDDDFGTRILSQLSAVGVDVSPMLVRTDQPTGITVVLSAAPDRAMLTLTGAMATLTPTEALTALDCAVATPGGAAHLHVASPFLLTELLDELPVLLRAAKAHGLTTSLDPNDAPSDEWRRLDPTLALVDVLLPNAREAVEMTGISDPRRAGLELVARGPLVVVKDGAAGAFACRTGYPTLSAAGAEADVLDTTGAGDTFDAAFLDGWLDGRDLNDCLRRAVRAGALNVRALGGTAGQPVRAQLHEPGRSHDHH